MEDQASKNEIAIEAESLTAEDMAEKVTLALTNYFSDGSDEFGRVNATRNGTEVHLVAVDEGDAEHDERERRYAVTVRETSQSNQTAESSRASCTQGHDVRVAGGRCHRCGETEDPLSDPRNASVVAALHAAANTPLPPTLDRDPVVAMLRDKGLWKPEYDDVQEQQQ